MRSIYFLLKEILATALRIEAKLDILVRRLKDPNAPVVPMGYQGQVDPLSQQPVKYVPVALEDQTYVNVRRDGNAPATSELPTHMG